MLGRDRLYEHMVQTYYINIGWNGTPNMLDSRDLVEEWLRYQHVNTIHQRQRKPKSIDHFSPARPLHSISIDLIDYTKNGSSYTNPADGRSSIYKYMLIIIDNYSRYMWAFPLGIKEASQLGFSSGTGIRTTAMLLVWCLPCLFRWTTEVSSPTSM